MADRMLLLNGCVEVIVDSIARYTIRSIDLEVVEIARRFDALAIIKTDRLLDSGNDIDFLSRFRPKGPVLKI